MRRTILRVIAAASVLLSLYVGSYFLNANCGGYWLKPQPGTRELDPGGIHWTSAIYWMPRYGSFWKDEPLDAVGVLYAPLVWLDRRTRFPTRDLFDPDFQDWLDNAPLAEFHPDFRAEVAEARQKRPRSP